MKDKEEVYRGAKLFGTTCAAIGFCLLVWWVVIEYFGKPVIKFVSEL